MGRPPGAVGSMSVDRIRGDLRTSSAVVPTKATESVSARRWSASQNPRADLDASGELLVASEAPAARWMPPALSTCPVDRPSAPRPGSSKPNRATGNSSFSSPHACTARAWCSHGGRTRRRAATADRQRVRPRSPAMPPRSGRPVSLRGHSPRSSLAVVPVEHLPAPPWRPAWLPRAVGLGHDPGQLEDLLVLAGETRRLPGCCDNRSGTHGWGRGSGGLVRRAAGLFRVVMSCRTVM